MNTTLELPDDLLREIEHRAESSGLNFSETLTSLLREALKLKYECDAAAARPMMKTHPVTGLPYFEFPHAAVEELTPQRVADLLLEQEVNWQYALLPRDCGRLNR